MNERLPFGEKVRELRKSKRLSQNALAKIAGVSPRTIFGYEAGTTYPRTASTLNRLAEALGVTSEALADNTHPLKSLGIIPGSQSMETQCQMITQQAVSLLLDDHLPDAQKDDMVQAILDAYWESRRRSPIKNDTTT